MEKEDKLLLAGVEDKMYQCLDYEIPVNTGFLDMRQCTLVYNHCKRTKGIRFLLEGGYPEAERKICIFMPLHEMEHHPMAALRVQKKGPNNLTHRDYLGSILGLGIKREQVGDILVTPEGANVLILEELTDFFLYNLDKVGNTPVTVQLIPLSEVSAAESHFEEIRLTVSSLRLDNVVAAVYKTSRSGATEAIQKGLVYINGMQTIKTDKILQEGDKIVYRGKGKNILSRISGKTAKDKNVVFIHKYL